MIILLRKKQSLTEPVALKKIIIGKQGNYQYLLK